MKSLRRGDRPGLEVAILSAAYELRGPSGWVASTRTGCAHRCAKEGHQAGPSGQTVAWAAVVNPRPDGSGVVPVSSRPCDVRIVVAMAVVKPVDMPVGLDVLLREEELVPLGWPTCGRLARLAEVIKDLVENRGLARGDEGDDPHLVPAFWALERIYFEDLANQLSPSPAALLNMRRENLGRCLALGICVAIVPPQNSSA